MAELRSRDAGISSSSNQSGTASPSVARSSSTSVNCRRNSDHFFKTSLSNQSQKGQFSSSRDCRNSSKSSRESINLSTVSNNLLPPRKRKYSEVFSESEFGAQSVENNSAIEPAEISSPVTRKKAAIAAASGRTSKYNRHSLDLEQILSLKNIPSKAQRVTRRSIATSQTDKVTTRRQSLRLPKSSPTVSPGRRHTRLSSQSSELLSETGPSPSTKRRRVTSKSSETSGDQPSDSPSGKRSRRSSCTSSAQSNSDSIVSQAAPQSSGVPSNSLSKSSRRLKQAQGSSAQFDLASSSNNTLSSSAPSSTGTFIFGHPHYVPPNSAGVYAFSPSDYIHHSAVPASAPGASLAPTSALLELPLLPIPPQDLDQRRTSPAILKSYPLRNRLRNESASTSTSIVPSSSSAPLPSVPLHSAPVYCTSQPPLSRSSLVWVQQPQQNLPSAPPNAVELHRLPLQSGQTSYLSGLNVAASGAIDLTTHSGRPGHPVSIGSTVRYPALSAQAPYTTQQFYAAAPPYQAQTYQYPPHYTTPVNLFRPAVPAPGHILHPPPGGYSVQTPIPYHTTAISTPAGGFFADTIRRLRKSNSDSTADQASGSTAGNQVPGGTTSKKSSKDSKSYWRGRVGGASSSAGNSRKSANNSGSSSSSSTKRSSSSRGSTSKNNNNTSTTGACTSSSQHWTACAGKRGGGSTTSSAGGSAEATASMSAGAASSGTGANAPSSSVPNSGLLDADSDSEMGRLESLLQARGLPPTIFSSLGPRMHHLLNRSSSSGSKAHQLLQGLQASGDESQQLQALIEMCQLLVMGNEETLSGFPIKQVTPQLINLLSMEHNFEIMNHACRALTYMLEALPRSASVIVDAVPMFLQKLQVIECMDVAEQSLTALESLSRKHSKAILLAGGISSCLTFLDFFSMVAARSALSITANCCQMVSNFTFHLVEESLPVLANKVNPEGDKKSVESACLAYSRLIDNFQSDPEKLKCIAKHNLLSNMQKLVTAVPPLLSSNSLILVLRQMALLSKNCPPLAVELLSNNVADTLMQLLSGGVVAENSEELEIVPRSPQEQYEIASLAHELFPDVPSVGIFAVDCNNPHLHSSHHGAKYVQPPLPPVSVLATPQTRMPPSSSSVAPPASVAPPSESLGLLQSAPKAVSSSDLPQAESLNENCFAAGSDHSSDDLNPNEGQALLNPDHLLPVPLEPVKITPNESVVARKDPRQVCLESEPDLAANYFRKVFNLLYELYCKSAGPGVKHKTLKVLLRMVYFAPPDLLEEVIRAQHLSSQLATMLSSTDLKIVIVALQLAELLMNKLQEVFSIYFRREGVQHQIKKLCEGSNFSQMKSTPQSTEKRISTPPSNSSSIYYTPQASGGADWLASIDVPLSPSPLLAAARSMSDNLGGEMGASLPPPPSLQLPGTEVDSSLVKSYPQSQEAIVEHLSYLLSQTTSSGSLDTTSTTSAGGGSKSPTQMRLPEVLKRKRTSRTGGVGGSGGTGSRWRKSKQEDASNNVSSTSSSSQSIGEYLLKSLTSQSSQASPQTTSMWTSRNVAPSPSISIPSHAPPSSRPKALSSVKVGSSSSSRSHSSFFSSFNPVRWGRAGGSNSSSSTPVASQEPKSSSSYPPSWSGGTASMMVPPHVQIACTANRQRDALRQWIRDQAQRLDKEYFGLESQGMSHPALSVLNRLIPAIQQLQNQPKDSVPSLQEIMSIVTSSDISSFELIHSGLVSTLLVYLTADTSKTDSKGSDKNAESYEASKSTGASPINSGVLDPSVVANISQVNRDDRLRNFLHVFLGCSTNRLTIGGSFDPSCVERFTGLLSKLMSCVNQLEQFPVKVHDLPSGGSSGNRGASSAIKFLNTHQLKCNLQRHPSCNRLREWRGGPVKVDPLALVQAIERYLVMRGYARLKDNSSDDQSDDDNTDDEDIDESMAAISAGSGQQHKLEFLIGDHILPYNMTVFQAIRHYNQEITGNETESESEVLLTQSYMWQEVHTIYYRPVVEDSSNSKSSRKGRGASKVSPKKKSTPENQIGDVCLIGGGSLILDSLLSTSLTSIVSVKDPSLEVLALVKVLCILNRYYASLYPPGAPSKPPVSMLEFQNSKLTAKANRQLQDPLVIMTGNLPPWLQQIAYSCPFLFPFETRQLLFYTVSFDRDRAILRLQETNPELNHGDSTERVTPRLDRKKKTVSRDDILKQAESVINESVPSKAMLEIQYTGEVGSGLGPTLEFYALVSKEMKKADLELWRGGTVTVEEDDNNADQMEGIEESGSSSKKKKSVKFVNSSSGLYPMPVAKSVKSAALNKMKSKFKFLGKFMAKAVMDNRMVDLNLHECMMKWMVGEERGLGLSDVLALDPEFGGTLKQLHGLVLEKRKIFEEGSAQKLPMNEIQAKMNSVNLDGCDVSDLALNFTLPGYASIELKKGGTDTDVTITNIDYYLKLVVEWLLREGVWKQMEAFKEGFDSVFPMAQLNVFYPEELELVFCGNSSNEKWDAKVLAECCKIDHGYTSESQAVKSLFQILSEYSPSEQRNFLQFTTGSPRLPVGGFRSLSPPLTIVRKVFEGGVNEDDFLPSVMTCVNYLKLPEYSTREIMKQKLAIAISEGQHCFHLS